MAGVQRGGRGEVECEREARSLGASMKRRESQAMDMVQDTFLLEHLKHPRSVFIHVKKVLTYTDLLWGFLSLCLLLLGLNPGYRNFLFQDKLELKLNEINDYKGDLGTKQSQLTSGGTG